MTAPDAATATSEDATLCAWLATSARSTAAPDDDGCDDNGCTGDGTVTLVEATPDGFSQKGQFKLSPQSDNRHIKGKVWTHPVVIGGKLFLRDQEFVHCYDVSG